MARPKTINRSVEQRQTVYPDPWVLDVFGEKSGAGVFNKAIELAAGSLRLNTYLNAREFVADEWRQLCDELGDANLQVNWNSPGAVLGLQISNNVLAKKVAALSWERVHAIMWTLQWAKRFATNLENDQWWTLEYRAGHGKG